MINSGIQDVLLGITSQNMGILGYLYICVRRRVNGMEGFGRGNGKSTFFIWYCGFNPTVVFGR